MSASVPKSPRKNPLARTQAPQVPPSARSRTAHGLTAAAAEGRFALQVCADCTRVIYPPRDACSHCLSPKLVFKDVAASGTLLAETTIRTSADGYFRERMPWRIGTVLLDCGPAMLAHLHADVREGGRVRMRLQLDKAGQAAAFAMPLEDRPDMAADRQLREMICDPKERRVLITDGRSTIGLAMAQALSAAGASVVFAGIADPWKPFSGEAKLRDIARAEIVPLDLTDNRSVADLARDIGARVEILINTSEYVRLGGIVGQKGIATAREEMEIRYFGLLRLAQSFGPVLRARGADGAAPACAFVNLIGVHALMNWPAFGTYSATEAACLSAAQCLRTELRSGGVKVVNVFHGPLETDWYQTIAPPKVAPAALAKAVVAALVSGLEDVFVGDVAEDIRARLAVNPKALERELEL
jgi:NAD(P)-dependent dehydrogenase (short-subunit alcohol dehydrogenase family)/uncharacterized OB-fold protein